MMCAYRDCAAKFSEKMCWLPPLLSRLVLAGVFIQTGWGKIHYIDKVTAFFTQLAISQPAFSAYLVAYTEFTCGILILFGFLTRLAAIPLSIIMIIALSTAHAKEIQSIGTLFSLPPFLYLVLCIGLIVMGAGKVSVDAMFHKHHKRKHKH